MFYFFLYEFLLTYNLRILIFFLSHFPLLYTCVCSAHGNQTLNLIFSSPTLLIPSPVRSHAYRHLGILINMTLCTSKCATTTSTSLPKKTTSTCNCSMQRLVMLLSKLSEGFGWSLVLTIIDMLCRDYKEGGVHNVFSVGSLELWTLHYLPA